jgi:hypothetical protein
MQGQRPLPPLSVMGCRPRSLHSSPMWGLSKSERRRHGAEILYELETGFREEGWPSEEFVYDAEHDLYRFPDGEFAYLQGVRQRGVSA